MNPIRFFNMIIWASPVVLFFYALGTHGSLPVAVFITAIPLVAIIGVGLLERIDPYIGLPTLRWSVWNGTYKEPDRSRIKTCPTCHGRGSIRT